MQCVELMSLFRILLHTDDSDKSVSWQTVRYSLLIVTLSAVAHANVIRATILSYVGPVG
jgi:hypothetical protein